MRAPITKRILPELGLRGIIDTLNVFLNQVTNGLNKDITFTENIACQIHRTSFTTLATYSSDDFTPITIERSLRQPVMGVILMQIVESADNPSVIVEPVSLVWREVDNIVYIDFVSGLSNSTGYNLTVMLV